MDTLERITVGVGLHSRTGVPDAGSVQAARQAAWVSAKTGAHVALVHAAWAEDGSGPVELHSKAMDELDQLATSMAIDGARVSIDVVEEYPWLALCRRAIRGDAEMILAGKRATTETGRRRVGSTAVKLLRKCPAPVWLVKPDHDLTYRHVLAATDLSPVSDAVLAASAWVSSRSDGELHVLHAWNLSWGEQRAAADLSEDDYSAKVEEVRARALASLERQADTLDVDPTLHLERGDAHIEIMEKVEHEHPDLLVIGSLSKGGRAGFDVGTIAERVLEQVDESLLTFKPNDFVCPVVPDQAGS
ncbi:MAG: universal stress protein [Planctomycetota bacterium]